MTIFATALKNDLLDAQMMFSLKKEFDLSGVMGNLARVIEPSAKLIEGQVLTPAEELQYFRTVLYKRLDAEFNIYDPDANLEAQARKVVDDLTEFSHLL